MKEEVKAGEAGMVFALKQTFSSLSVRNFRLFALGQGISLCGTWAQMIAMAWLVLELTHSGTQLGLVVAAQFLPILLFGAWGGVIADRFNKRRVLYFTQSIAAALAFVLGILVICHLVQLWMVYVLAVGVGLTQVVDSPSRQAFVIEMVGKARLKNAVALNATLVNLGRIVGPTIAGILIVTIGIGPCFIVNALSFVALLTALALMRTDQLHPTPPVPKEKGQIQAGLRYAWSVPEIRAVLLMIFITGIFTYEFPVVLPLMATRTFHGGASTYSALTAVMSAGAMGAALYTASKGQASAKALIRIALLFGFSIMLLALTPGVVSALIVILFVGIFSILLIALSNATLQLTTRPEMRGRIMSFMVIAFLGTTPIGGPIIGYISDHSNPRVGLFVGGLAAVLAAGVGYLANRHKPDHALPQ